MGANKRLFEVGEEVKVIDLKTKGVIKTTVRTANSQAFTVHDLQGYEFYQCNCQNKGSIKKYEVQR